MTESTFEQRMAQRARRAAIKRRIQQNLEGEVERNDSPSLGTQIMFCVGFETGERAIWATPVDEWLDVVGVESER